MSGLAMRGLLSTQQDQAMKALAAWGCRTGRGHEGRGQKKQPRNEARGLSVGGVSADRVHVRHQDQQGRGHS
jgi:cytochrome c553